MLANRVAIVLAALVATAVGASTASDARPPGGTIVWEIRAEGQSIAMARADGTDRRMIAPAVYRGPGIISSYHPMLSADGTRVVFARQFLGDSGDTRLCTRSTRPPYRRATCRQRDGRESLHPVWAPDADAIAFVRRRAASYTLASVAPRGGAARTIAVLRTPAAHYPGTETLLTHQAWSPDGRRLVFASGGEIFTVGRDGSRLRMLTRNPRAWDRAPAWSPDGSKIAWLRGGNIHVMNPDGSQKTRVTSLRATPKGFPAWSSRAGRVVLAFTAGDALYVTRARYHRPSRLGRFASVRGYAWSPDGTKLVVATRFPRPALWIVSAETGARRRLLVGADDLVSWVSPSWRG